MSAFQMKSLLRSSKVLVLRCFELLQPSRIHAKDGNASNRWRFILLPYSELCLPFPTPYQLGITQLFPIHQRGNGGILLLVERVPLA